jgi:integrase/recombinase XerD
MPCLVRGSFDDGQVPRPGHPLLDDYLGMVAARARPNTVLATAFDLKVFFSVVGKQPEEIRDADVLAFIRTQRQPRRGATVVRIEDGEAGLSARTIKRRLASVTGLFEYLVIRGVVPKNLVPHGLSTRSPNRGGRRVPLIRTPRTMPRVIDPDQAPTPYCRVAHAPGSGDGAGDAVGRAAALRGPGPAAARRASRGEATVHRRGEGRASTDRSGLTTILHHPGRLPRHRATTRVVDGSGVRRAQGPAAGQPLSAAGLDEIVAGARRRAGIAHLTCHQLRHTCFTRLREAGMALEAIQAQAGHRSIESTRIYLHLANDWLAEEYRRAAEAIDAQALQVP